MAERNVSPSRFSRYFTLDIFCGPNGRLTDQKPQQEFYTEAENVSVAMNSRQAPQTSPRKFMIPEYNSWLKKVGAIK